MAYYSLNAYDADVRIQQFAGLNMYGDGINGDVRFATEAANMDTIGGMLQPPAEHSIVDTMNRTDPQNPVASLTGRIITLASFFRMDYSQLSVRQEVYIASCDGTLYYRPTKPANAVWTALNFPTGVEAYQNDEWSWARYERGYTNSSNEAQTESVLLMSNIDDGMIMIHTDLTVEAVQTPELFDVIEVHAERVWGAAVRSHRDTLYYSGAFDPTAWTPSTDIYDTDGPDQIRQPTWDGDKIMSLKSFGGQLIVQMQRRIFRIIGTSPGDFTVREMYGAGTFNHRTVAIHGERMYFAGEDGLTVFDGQTASGYLRQAIKPIWDSLTSSERDLMNAAVYDDKYVLAIPYYTAPSGDAATGGPNDTSSPGRTQLLIYNLTEGTVLRHDYDYAIKSLVTTYSNLAFVTWGTTNQLRTFGFDSWQSNKAAALECYWVTPWMDFANRLLRKGPFDVYFTPEMKKLGSPLLPVDLEFTIRTDVEYKTKTYTIRPLTMREHERDGEFKRSHLRFHVKGRRFRLEIRRKVPTELVEDSIPGGLPTGNYIEQIDTLKARQCWRLVGGLQMKVETEMTE